MELPVPDRVPDLVSDLVPDPMPDPTPTPPTPARPAPAPLTRRRAVRVAALAACALALPAGVRAARAVPAQMTDGPFYPPRAWRARWPDWDADLTRVQEAGRVWTARGEHLGLALRLADMQGRVIDGAEVEIWQCDVERHYRHPNVAREPGGYDEGFQGFGAGRTGREGGVAFRTIRPVPYPGRTPHIHIKVRHVTFGEWTSQLFLAADPGNERDFLWRRLSAQDKAALELHLRRAPAAAAAAGEGAPPLAWVADQAIALPS